jgi:hypothetical protein
MSESGEYITYYDHPLTPKEVIEHYMKGLKELPSPRCGTNVLQADLHAIIAHETEEFGYPIDRRIYRCPICGNLCLFEATEGTIYWYVLHDEVIALLSDLRYRLESHRLDGFKRKDGKREHQQPAG